jgi:hypothetical protein
LAIAWRAVGKRMAISAQRCRLYFPGLVSDYTKLLIAMGFVGLSGSVFHPADYAILSAQIALVRLGRAFSIHTFAGFLGNAVAPVAMLAVAASVGL